ncbi:MAG: sigma-54-dependent Fis family transcriptional regulator, partial [Lentisphaerae bacterium]|nr:sigma-54-dependent Fis family transcriptional regulator [Lentisphaerota bacterium]
GQLPINVDVRIVSATNTDLDELVKENRFRHDLLYRLKVVTIKLPSLRERVEDIRPLSDRFIAMACEEHGRRIDSVDPGCYQVLENYRWPGNIRQLKNTIESAVIMASSRSLIPEDIRLDPPESGRDEDVQIPANMSLAELERIAIITALRRNKGNQLLTAEELGVSQRTIQRKIKDYNLPFTNHG